MSVWSDLIGKLRNRGVLAEPPNEQEIEAERPRRPPPTPTTRVPERPEPTPSMHPRQTDTTTGATPSYGSPKGTPSTRRIHNPTHIR